MFENPLDLVWLIAAALAAVFGLASLVLAVDAVRRQYPGIVDVFGWRRPGTKKRWPRRPPSEVRSAR
jgi:hypothetical protein